MENTHSHSNDGKCCPKNQPTDKYKKGLCTTIKKTDSERKSKKTLYESKQEDYQYMVCSFIKTEEVYIEYRSINNCIATTLSEDMSIIKANLAVYEIAHKNLGETLFKGVKDSVKDIKKKVADIDPCSLEECINDSCNSEQKKKLCQLLPNYKDTVEAIFHQANECKSKAEKLFLDTAVISGVQTFANIDGLKDFGVRLSTAIENFKKDIDTNVKSTNDELIVAQTDLTKTIKEISKSKYEYYAKCLSLEAMIDTKAFICHPEPKCTDINCICNCGKKDGEDCPPKPKQRTEAY